MLKPQDILIVLKMHSLYSPRKGYAKSMGMEPEAAYTLLWSQREFSRDLNISLSEINSGLSRLEKSGLIGPRNEPGPPAPKLDALEELLVHGVKYVWPVKLGEITRGMPTGYAAPPLMSQFKLDDEELVPVWPDPEGTVRGYSFQPLYRSVPFAARRNYSLYQALALVDAIRGGRARERKLAIRFLKQWLRGEEFNAEFD